MAFVDGRRVRSARRVVGDSLTAIKEFSVVVEVSDETMLYDLEIKARLYGSAGYAVYWVITREAVYEHTDPTDRGYRTRVEYRAGERIPYGDSAIEVADLIAKA